MMARLGLLFGTLVLALLIAVLALQTPPPARLDAPETAFSAGRAMVDVRRIAREPHPAGTVAHTEVGRYLLGRMRTLGLQPTVQAAAMSPETIGRLREWGGDPDAANDQVFNLVGVLPGRDPSAKAVLLMAHYDSAWGSPGAADDATGVAAILETVRALKARGVGERPVVVVFTDAEELNLDGARAFFSEHPLRDRIGAVVNLEARGGGGRVMMFETGRGNAETIAVFSGIAPRVAGGVTSNSLAVVVYENMPNGTDFTVPKNRGLGGVNFAFVGRPSQYHSPTSTPEALDQGSVQHIGGQTLAVADALMRAEALPTASADVVYSDILGRIILSHAPATGWLLLGLAAALTGFAAWRASAGVGLRIVDLLWGALSGVWFTAAAMTLAYTARVLAGPIASRAGLSEAYYGLMRRLPWMEVGVGLAILAVALVVLAGRNGVGRRVPAGVMGAATLLALALGGFNIVVLGAGVLATGLCFIKTPEAGTRQAGAVWGSWLGLIGLVLALGLAAQAVVPTAAYLWIWTGLLAALAAAITALLDVQLERPLRQIPAALAAVLGGAWLLSLAHPTFLGVGMDLPGAMAGLALPILMLIRPLGPFRHGIREGHALAMAAAACLVLAAGVSLAARVVEPFDPPAETGPT